MSEYQLIELVFLAALAGYLIYRLYSVLGQSDDDSPNTGKKNGNVVHLHPPSNKIKEAIKVSTHKPSNAALKPLLKVDPTFDEGSFLQGVEVAFMMIVDAFSKEKLDEVQSFLSKKVYESFKATLLKRAQKGETYVTQVIGINSIKITEVSVSKGFAKITVQILSDQAITIQDKDGKDLYPENDEIESITDQWTFRRKINSDDPNWVLQEIHEVRDEKLNDG